MEYAMPPEATVYLTKQELAVRWRVKVRTIEIWVRTGKCPKPIKLTPGAVRFDANDILTHEAAIRAKCR